MNLFRIHPDNCTSYLWLPLKSTKKVQLVVQLVVAGTRYKSKRTPDLDPIVPILQIVALRWWSSRRKRWWWGFWLLWHRGIVTAEICIIIEPLSRPRCVSWWKTPISQRAGIEQLQWTTHLENLWRRTIVLLLRFSIIIWCPFSLIFCTFDKSTFYTAANTLLKEFCTIIAKLSLILALRAIMVSCNHMTSLLKCWWPKQKWETLAVKTTLVVRCLSH